MPDLLDATNGDGRHARRDRNKYAVVDAFLDLVRAGVARPSVADVAERSGVSHRSVFRYFADKDELARTAIERQQEFARPLVSLTVGPGAPFEERVARFVERRLALYQTLAPVARLSRALVQTQPVIAAELTANRKYLRSQVQHLFQPELARMATLDSGAALAALDVLCSFESVELITHDQGLSLDDAAAVLTVAIRRMLLIG